MARAIALRSDFNATELRRLARRSNDAAQARRLLALAVIHDGGTRSEAALLGNVTLQIVRDWVMRFNADGPDGLIDRKAPGPTPLLSDAHRQALAAQIDCGPIPAVHGVGTPSASDSTSAPSHRSPAPHRPPSCPGQPEPPPAAASRQSPPACAPSSFPSHNLPSLPPDYITGGPLLGGQVTVILLTLTGVGNRARSIRGPLQPTAGPSHRYEQPMDLRLVLSAARCGLGRFARRLRERACAREHCTRFRKHPLLGLRRERRPTRLRR